VDWPFASGQLGRSDSGRLERLARVLASQQLRCRLLLPKKWMYAWYLWGGITLRLSASLVTSLVHCSIQENAVGTG